MKENCIVISEAKGNSAKDENIVLGSLPNESSKITLLYPLNLQNILSPLEGCTSINMLPSSTRNNVGKDNMELTQISVDDMSGWKNEEERTVGCW